jgi:phosphatidylglycerol---prolipoprotein diacylglyceryl transferase
VNLLAENFFAVIYWNVQPELFSWGYLHPRWYGLFFAIGFLVAYSLLAKVFRREGIPVDEAYRVFLYVFVGTLVGARLGHVLFYDPAFFFNNPLAILKIWEGGLASHGGTIGIVIAVWLYARNTKGVTFLWIADRASLVCLATAASVRIGNLFNSEILGKATDLPWAFVFERFDNIPRHPAQLYEAIAYLVILALLWRMYNKIGPSIAPGKITGILFITVFSARFLIEFVKEVQEPFERGLPLDMGQILSIPFVLVGIWLWLRSRNVSTGNPAAN